MVKVLLKCSENSNTVKLSDDVEVDFLELGEFKSYENAINAKKFLDNSEELFSYAKRLCETSQELKSDKCMCRLFISDYIINGVRDVEISNDRYDGNFFNEEGEITVSTIKGYTEVLSIESEAVMQSIFESIINSENSVANDIYILFNFLKDCETKGYDEKFEIQVLMSLIKNPESHTLYRSIRDKTSKIIRDSLVIEQDGSFSYINEPPDGYDTVESSKSLEFLLKRQKHLFDDIDCI